MTADLDCEREDDGPTCAIDLPAWWYLGYDAAQNDHSRDTDETDEESPTEASE